MVCLYLVTRYVLTEAIQQTNVIRNYVIWPGFTFTDKILKGLKRNICRRVFQTGWPNQILTFCVSTVSLESEKNTFICCSIYFYIPPFLLLRSLQSNKGQMLIYNNGLAIFQCPYCNEGIRDLGKQQQPRRKRTSSQARNKQTNKKKQQRTTTTKYEQNNLASLKAVIKTLPTQYVLQVKK